jgi:putative MATE family efflux protein
MSDPEHIVPPAGVPHGAAPPEAPPSGSPHDPQHASKPDGMWASLRLALRGTEMDFTQGSLGKAVFLLSVPMVLEMLGESVFAVVDAFFVGRLGAAPLAAVALAETFLEIIYAIAIGLSMATTAMVARRIGEKNVRGASITAVQAIAVGIVLGVLMGGIGAVYAPTFLRLMGADEATVAVGTGYTRFLYGGMIWILLLFLINAIFRGAGDATSAMHALWVANAINIVLDPLLILGIGPFPELGLTGAGIATTIGRGTGVVFQIVWLMRPGRRLRVSREDIRLDFPIIKRMLRLSIGGIGQFLISQTSWIGLVRILSTYGTQVLAGYMVAIRIVIFVVLPAWGMSNAAATLVGQNLGARNPERAARSAWLTGYYNMAFMLAVTFAFVVFPRPMIAFFTKDPVALETGVECLRIISYGYAFYAWGMVMMNAFNGAGDTLTPTWINFLCFWLVQIPLAALTTFVFHTGPQGVFWAIAIAYSLSAVVGFYLFRLGRWKEKEA